MRTGPDGAEEVEGPELGELYGRSGTMRDVFRLVASVPTEPCILSSSFGASGPTQADWRAARRMTAENDGRSFNFGFRVVRK